MGAGRRAALSALTLPIMWLLGCPEANTAAVNARPAPQATAPALPNTTGARAVDAERHIPDTAHAERVQALMSTLR